MICRALLPALLLSVALGLGGLPAHAEEPATPMTVPSADKVAFKGLIDAQIAAFKAGDAEGAFRVVAPALREKFGSPDRFLEVVRVGYAPVANPRSYRYGHAVPLDARTTGQWLHVVGPDGERVDALYLMERQPDGSWKTSGCLLYEAASPAV